MPIVFPSDVKQLQAKLASEREALQASIEACPVMSGNETTMAQWTAQTAAVDAFLQQSPSWLHTAAQMNAGEALKRDLDGWVARVAGAGCNAPPSGGDAPDSPAVKTLRAGALLAGVAAAGWVAVKIVDRVTR